MMSGVSLETCWAIKKHCNNKFYYTVASCWLFLYDYDAIDKWTSSLHDVTFQKSAISLWKPELLNKIIVKYHTVIVSSLTYVLAINRKYNCSCRQPQTYVKPEAAITVFEHLMMSGVSLETCWAIRKHWNNKFYYTVASCWLFLYDLYYDARIHERQTWFRWKNNIKIHAEGTVWISPPQDMEK